MNTTLESPLRVLLVEDNPNDARLIRRHLTESDSPLLPDSVDFYHAESLDAGVTTASEHAVDLLLLDLGLPESEATETYHRARERIPDVPVVVLTNLDDDQAAVELLNRGAQDYLSKRSLNERNLIRSVRYAVERWERQRELEQYERIVESMDDVAVIVDRDWSVVYANEYALEQADITMEQLRGTPALEMAEQLFASRESIDHYETVLEELFEGDGETEPYRFEVKVDLPGGEEIREYQLSPLERSGEVTAAVVIARNITDRKERERELERKTRAIEAAPVGVTITDPDQEDNPVIYVNDRYEEMIGYTAEDALGRNLRFLQGERTESEPVDKIRAAIEEQRPVTVELRNYKKDGTEFWNRVSIAPVRDTDGNLINFVGFQQDITEEKEREQKLQTRNEQLEVLNRILRHDIRNDTQTVQLWVEKLQSELPEIYRDELQRIHRTNNHIQELTENSRALIQALTQEQLETEPVRVDEIVQGELDSARSRYPDAEFSIEGSLSGTVVSANGTLSSVVRNLLNNAVQHNRDQATVTVRVEQDDDVVRLWVLDNGPGVPDDQKEEIFGKGERGLDSEGTGIGLYLVNQLVQSYNGDVWVEDRETDDHPGQTEHDDPDGAAFVVELPAATNWA